MIIGWFVAGVPRRERGMSIADLLAPPFDAIRCDDPRLQVSLPALAAFGPASVAQTAASTDPATRQVLAGAANWLRSSVSDTARHWMT
jgi:hypothetical protein